MLASSVEITGKKELKIRTRWEGFRVCCLLVCR